MRWNGAWVGFTKEREREGCLGAYPYLLCVPWEVSCVISYGFNVWTGMFYWFVHEVLAILSCSNGYLGIPCMSLRWHVSLGEAIILWGKKILIFKEGVFLSWGTFLLVHQLFKEGREEEHMRATNGIHENGKLVLDVTSMFGSSCVYWCMQSDHEVLRWYWFLTNGGRRLWGSLQPPTMIWKRT